MKPYEIKCLIFIIISILYLYSNSYKKETFANFISDFGNGGEEFFSSSKVYLDFIKRDKDWAKYYKKYYN